MTPARELQPKIAFTHRAEVRSENEQYTIDLIIGIENVGQQMVRYLSIEIGRDRLFKLNEGGLDSKGRHGLALQPSSSDPTQTNYVFRGGVNDIIYPGKTLEVTRLTARVPAGPEAIQTTTLQYELHCEGFDMKGEIKIGLEETIMHNWRP
jgi:hypothetical protein